MDSSRPSWVTPGGMREGHQSLYGRKTPRSLTGVPVLQKFKKSRAFCGKGALEVGQLASNGINGLK